MKSELSLSEWKAAEVVVSPHEMFTLWLIHDGLCQNLTDFKTHFGDELDPAVSKLEQAGFITQESRGLFLTEAGERIISYLTHEESEQRGYTEFKTLAQAEKEARGIVNAWSAGAAAVGWVPSSMFILAGADVKLVGDIAKVFGVQKYSIEEISATIGASVTGRVIAGETWAFVPGLGWLVKSAVAAATTKAAGEVIIRYFKERSLYS